MSGIQVCVTSGPRESERIFKTTHVPDVGDRLHFIDKDRGYDVVNRVLGKEFRYEYINGELCQTVVLRVEPLSIITNCEEEG